MSDESFFLMLILLGIIQVVLLLAILGWDRKIRAFFSRLFKSSFFIPKEPSSVESKKTEGDDDKKRVFLFRGDVDVVFKSLGLLKGKFLGGNSTRGVNTCAAAAAAGSGVNSACGVNGNSTCEEKDDDFTCGVINTCGEIGTTHFKCSMKTCGAYCSTCEVTTDKSPLLSSTSDEIHQGAKKTEEIWDSEEVSKLFDEEAAEAAVVKEEEVKAAMLAVVKEEEVKAAFDVYDENKDGFIDEFELQRILCGLGFKEGLEVENCRKMITLADKNADGMLDFTEFVNFLEKCF